jgi:hypothetical protein
MAAYASNSEALGHAEIEMDKLEDLIEEAEDDGNERKVIWLKKCLAYWVDCTQILEKMLQDTAQSVVNQDVVVQEVASDVLTGNLPTTLPAGCMAKDASSITST